MLVNAAFNTILSGLNINIQIRTVFAINMKNIEKQRVELPRWLSSIEKKIMYLIFFNEKNVYFKVEWLIFKNVKFLPCMLRLKATEN